MVVECLHIGKLIVAVLASIFISDCIKNNWSGGSLNCSECGHLQISCL